MIPREWWPSIGKAIRYGAYTAIILGLPIGLFATQATRDHIAGIMGWVILWWLLVVGPIVMAFVAWTYQRDMRR